MGQRASRMRTVGVRAVAVAAALVVGVSGLTACRSNVGTAATIDGHRVTESDVSGYVTGSSEPIKSSDGSQSIAPKPFVVDVLILQRLYQKLLTASPSGAPSAGQLTTLRRQYLAGSSAKAAVERLGAKGYDSSFNSRIVEVQVLRALLGQEQQQGVDISAIARKISFPVRVSPRYGRWDAAKLQFDPGPESGLPGFLTLQKSSTSQP